MDAGQANLGSEKRLTAPGFRPKSANIQALNRCQRTATAGRLAAIDMSRAE